MTCYEKVPSWIVIFDSHTSSSHLTVGLLYFFKGSFLYKYLIITKALHPPEENVEEKNNRMTELGTLCIFFNANEKHAWRHGSESTEQQQRKPEQGLKRHTRMIYSVCFL